MRRWIAVATLLLAAVATRGQNSNSVTVQVVAPPTWTITVSPSNYYQSKAATMTITVTVGVVTNTCTATWDAVSLPLSFPTALSPNPVALIASVTTAMTSTLGTHTVFITCPVPVLTMNSPVVLPNGKVGATYSAALPSITNLSGGVPPYTWTLSSGALPTGLSLSSDGTITGTPSSAVSSAFGFTVTDTSGLALHFIPKMVSGGA